MIDFARPVLPPSTAAPPSLGDKIARLSAHIEAATGRLFALIREFDASEEWHREGCTTAPRRWSSPTARHRDRCLDRDPRKGG